MQRYKCDSLAPENFKEKGTCPSMALECQPECVLFPLEGRLWNLDGTRKTTQTTPKQRDEGPRFSILMDINNLLSYN